MNQKSLFAGAVVAMAVVFVGATLAFNASKRGAVSSETMATLDRDHAAMVGPANAPVVIAEFLDPACETCAQFYPAVKSLMDANPGQIRLVLRWAPFHNGSRDVVAMLEATRKQDKFWPALERLLASQRAWTANHTANLQAAWQQLGGLELDREQIMADMRSAEVTGIIDQDLADAASLSVTMTPEYFVNGKQLPSFGWAQLEQLVNEALAETR